MQQILLHLTLLIAISVTVFFSNLGQSRLWDRDEPRNAGCAVEMLARGDWVVPMFNDELRHQKPVLLYWLIMSAYHLFGQSEFAARFWSALLAVGTILATYGIARRMANPLVALLAGMALSSNLMFTVAARAATPDSLLIFCGTVAILFYVLGTFAPPHRSISAVTVHISDSWFPKDYRYVIGIYVMLGLGVLTKGPIGFLLPMAIIGLFMLIQRLPEHVLNQRFLKKVFAVFNPLHFLKTLWTMRPLSATVIVLFVAAPWYVWVDTRTSGDFTELFFLTEHFGRATTVMENHSGGLWFYPLSIAIGFFPWSIFFVPICLWLVQRQHSRKLSPLMVLAVCWVAVQVSVFSIAQTKLPSYVTPCYPALAMLTAACLGGWITREFVMSRKWIFAALATLIPAGILVSVGLGVATHLYVPNQRWLIIIGLVPIAGGVVAIWKLRQNRPYHAVLATAVSSIGLCVVMFGFGTVAIDTAQTDRDLFDRISRLDDQQLVVSYRVLEPSWVFYCQKPIYESVQVTNSKSAQTLKHENMIGILSPVSRRRQL